MRRRCPSARSRISLYDIIQATFVVVGGAVDRDPCRQPDRAARRLERRPDAEREGADRQARQDRAADLSRSPSVLAALGIDLTALTVFSGALGVGIGIGLQKVVSNFVSGIIILLDKSIKPGDTISLGDTYGWVQGAARPLRLRHHARRALIPDPERGFHHAARGELVVHRDASAARRRFRRRLFERPAPGAQARGRGGRDGRARAGAAEAGLPHDEARRIRASTSCCASGSSTRRTA